MTPDLRIIMGDARTVESIMPVMESAFDPAFGEAWTAQQCTGMLCLPGTILLMAVQDNDVCGFALARSVLDEAELLLIATASHMRRQGIGIRLIESLIDWCKKNSVKRVILEVRSGNPALELYTNVGFIEIGRRENYYKGLENSQFDALTLQLNI